MCMFVFMKDHPDYRIDWKKTTANWGSWGGGEIGREKRPLSLIQLKGDTDWFELD